MPVAALHQFFIHASRLGLVRGSFSRPITAAAFKNPTEHRTEPKVRREAISLARRFAAVSGLDRAGADTISITGSFYDHFQPGKPLHPDVYERLTVEVYDQGRRMLYFHRTTDKTFWNKIHIPRDTKGPHWPIGPIYFKSTKKEYLNFRKEENENEARATAAMAIAFAFVASRRSGK